MTPDPIEYKRPSTPAGGADPIVTRMMQKHALTTATALGLLAAGAGIVLIAGAIVATVLCFILYSITGSTWIGWWGWYLLFLLAMLPLLFWEEHRSRGNFLADRATDFSSAPSSRGEFELQNLQIGVAVYTDMLLWGPRAILMGIATLRGEKPLERAHRFERAAVIVRQLLEHDAAIPVSQVIRPGENFDELRATLRWMDDHDYIGISADHSRIWLSSIARAAMKDLR
jgi:MFS family permease